MEVASTVQPYEGEPHESNEDFVEEWQRRFLARSFQVEIMMKNSLYCMFSLLRLCFDFYGEIYVKNGYSSVRFWSHNILFLSAAKVLLGQCSRVSFL